MPFSTLDLPFGTLDTKTDERMLPNGALLVAENCSAQTVGGYTKRNGYTALATMPSICRLASRGNELLAVNGLTGLVSGYDSIDGAWSAKTGVLSNVLTSQSTIFVSSGVDIVKMSVAVASDGTKVDCWIDSAGSLYVQCSNPADDSFRVTAGPQLADLGTTATSLRAVAVGALVYVIYASPTAQTIKSVRVSGTAAAPQTLFSGANVDATLAQFDVSPLNSSDFVLVWKTNAGTVRAARLQDGVPPTVLANQQIAAEAPDGPIGCIATTGEFGAAAYHSTAAGGMRACCFNASTMVQTAAPFTVEAVTSPVAVNCGMNRIDATHARVVWDRGPSGITKATTAHIQIASGGAILGSQETIRNVSMASKPWTFNSLSYVNVYHKASPQETYYTVQLATTGGQPFYAPIAMHAYRVAYSSAPATCVLSDVAQTSAGVFAFNGALGYKTLAASTQNAAVATYVCDFASGARCMSSEATGLAVFAGGRGTACDGANVVDLNFLSYPTITQVTPGAVAAGGMDDGSYAYVAVYESTDIHGNTHRSTTSVAVFAITTAGAGRGKTTVVVDNLPMSQYGTSVLTIGCQVSLLRTVANAVADDSGHLVYRFVASAQMVRSVATTTFVDQAHDSTIASNRLLYTNGGALDREPPPPSTQLMLHKNRLWGISSADRKVIFYSGELAQGEAPWFSSEQQIRIESGGNCVALASMDDKLIVLKADRVFKIYGNGPDALGDNNDLTEAILVTGDAGCTDPRPSLTANGGLYFKSAKGLYGLSRGEELSYAGENADKYWIGYANIVAANILTDRQEIRFEVSGGTGVADALTGSAIAAQKVVLNYVTGQWTTHRNYQDATAVDALVVNGVYYWATAAGAVYKENTASFLDPSSTFVRELIRAAWIKPAGFQGWCRARYALLLCNRKTDHALTMFCENDYVAGTTTATKTWTAAQLATLPREQVNLHLVRQKGESYRFTVYDAPDGTLGTGEGATMYGLQLYAQALRGTFEKKLLAAARG